MPGKRLATVVSEQFGPKMRAITEMQRKFVSYLLETGTNNFTEAAKAAGYSEGGSYGALRVAAHRLSHDDKVQAAIHEEGQRRVNSLLPMAVKALENLVGNADHKAHWSAVERALTQGGLVPKSERKIVVEHSSEELIANIKQMAEELGLNPAQLLGDAAVTIDNATGEVIDAGE